MCTAVSWKGKHLYFGRTLDLEYSYGETVTITPRKFPFSFRRMGRMETHFAMIGMAYVVEGYPLYYDGMNEKGLAMAGLHFPHSTVYQKEKPGRDTVAPFELVPWILGQCGTMAEAKELLQNVNLAEIPFSAEIPLSPLHWMVSDGERSLVVECVKEGLKVYENPVGVLTNNPPFPMQMFHLSNYLNLTREVAVNRFSEKLELEPYSRGMGAMGLPGDLSSASRFVKAAFTKLHAVAGETDGDDVGQFFHIMGSVEQQKGCVRLQGGSFEKTVYTSCCDLEKGIYYYTTYENRQMTAVELQKEDLEGDRLISYPLIREEQIFYQNDKKKEGHR